jgi:hypothetical protein
MPTANTQYPNKSSGKAQCINVNKNSDISTYRDIQIENFQTRDHKRQELNWLITKHGTTWNMNVHPICKIFTIKRPKHRR